MENTPNNSNQQLEHYKQMYLEEKKKNDILNKDNEKLKKELNDIKNENQMLQNQIANNQPRRLTFTEALNLHLANSMMGNTNNNPNIDLSQILRDEMREKNYATVLVANESD